MPFREFRNLPGAELCYFQPGDYLIESGTPLRYVYYLQSGLVYREVVTASGNENFLNRRIDDDDADSIVGLLAAYNEENQGISQSGFVAQTECVCWRIPVEECKRYMRAHPELLERAIQLAMHEFTQLSNRFMARREKNAAAHLCNVLLNYSRKAEDGRVLLSKKFTNVEISKFVSVHKVTVANMIRALKEQDCVERTSEGLWLKDIPRLKEYATGQRTLDYKK